jgi:hypothetical protein
LPSLARPSSVVICPLTADTGKMHERVAFPLMITVQAPHCPSPQPKRGPLQSQIVAQDVEERGGRVYIQRVGFAVHIERDAAHCPRFYRDPATGATIEGSHDRTPLLHRFLRP